MTLGPVARTHDRVHFVHPPEQVGPATPQGRPLRRRRDGLLDPADPLRCLSFSKHRGTGRGLRRPSARPR
jgi:hypothetical protein